ncbi:beta-1,4-N-acetylgalactosaminyltransferase bre-4 [Eurytemora carolleeae]|uniref:beta-1,4-N-acetylgalactosaminyltransferase bre-4 n=1 Tax=Eurytemora carolleeae TaxID=1294199 RepID=UPI000C75F61A|nr:beta-1,4-N-acetylgalactosaminyltransferase bre-4 [Eurytemora carolleeae]|eukprot:XP_023338883.1 beta-1,4-N-acetylgalactosaminyltransferase bre-4-like [Eurytemora affinis]
MHPILQRQALFYRVIVVEQIDKQSFNRAALLNIGILEAQKLGSPTCFVFHDVDLLAEDDRNIYECVKGAARAMSVAASKWKYKLQYQEYCGGVMAIDLYDIKKFNGLANSFYGWGGEDDDLYHRLKSSNTSIIRKPANIARYLMLQHDSAVESPELKSVMEMSSKDKLMNEGLNNIEYKIKDVHETPLYTLIQAELPGPRKVFKVEQKSFFTRFSEQVGNTIQKTVQKIMAPSQEGGHYTGDSSWDSSKQTL